MVPLMTAYLKWMQIIFSHIRTTFPTDTFDDWPHRHIRYGYSVGFVLGISVTRAENPCEPACGPACGPACPKRKKINYSLLHCFPCNQQPYVFIVVCLWWLPFKGVGSLFIKRPLRNFTTMLLPYFIISKGYMAFFEVEPDCLDGVFYMWSQ